VTTEAGRRTESLSPEQRGSWDDRAPTGDVLEVRNRRVAAAADSWRQCGGKMNHARKSAPRRLSFGGARGYTTEAAEMPARVPSMTSMR